MRITVLAYLERDETKPDIVVEQVCTALEAGGHKVAVHGWVYGLDNGLLRDLGVSLESETDLHRCVKAAKSPRS